MEYIQNKEILVTEVDGSLMMMSIASGKYFELNPVSKSIWYLAEDFVTQESIVESLLKEFDVDEQQCQEEVGVHLKELVKKKILLTKS